MALIDKLREMVVPEKKPNEPQIPQRKKIEPLPPIFSNKPSTVGSLFEKKEEIRFSETEKPDLKNWVEIAKRELPNSDYYVENFSPKQLKELVIANRHGHVISTFADNHQTPAQLRYIYIHAEFGEDVIKYIHNTEFDPEALERKQSAEFTAEITQTHEQRQSENTFSEKTVPEIIVTATEKSEQTKITEQSKPIVKYISPEEIDLSNIQGMDRADWWNKKDYTKESYIRTAERIPLVQAELDKGKTLFEIRQNPELVGTVAAYFDPELRLKVKLEPNGKYSFSEDGGHRLAVAKLIGCQIPVVVTNVFEQSKETERILE